MLRHRRWLLLLLTIVVLAGVGALGVFVNSHGTGGGSGVQASRSNGLHVVGNSLVNGAGQRVQFHGVNRSGTEYACIQGWGIFDGPSDAQSVHAMAMWHINAVRIPLNEDCWLGINGVKPEFAAARYRTAISDYVHLLQRYGMYAELSLMWGAPGSAPATYQSNAPDEDHSADMWASMAATFANDPDVILAPWGETTVGWDCFRTGCDNEATFSSMHGPFDGDGSCGSACDYYTSAGMQQAVNVMRHAGYHGPIAVPCIAYANMCGVPEPGQEPYNGSTWVRSRPSDPDHELIAEMHIYGKNTCDTVACLNSSVLPILHAGYPVLFGETGETYDASDCGSSDISKFIDWADSHQVGYEAWAWDTSHSCLALIDDYAGSPHAAYGTWIRAHFAADPTEPVSNP